MVLSFPILKHIREYNAAFHWQKRTSHAGSKLTMSLVNVSLKFQTLIFKIHQYFFVEQCEINSFSHFYAPPQKVAGYYVIPSELWSVCPSVSGCSFVSAP